jgi:hypothetical protein
LVKKIQEICKYFLQCRFLLLRRPNNWLSRQHRWICIDRRIELGRNFRRIYPLKKVFFLLACSGRLPTLLYTVKKGYWFSCLQPGCHLPNSPTGRESLNYSRPVGVW